VFGPPSVSADAEVVDASAAILRNSGLSDFTVKIGDRRVVEDYVRKRIGIHEQEGVVELMRALDKVEKKTPEELRSEYAAKGFEGKQVDEVLAFGRLHGTPDEVLAKASELKLESVGELRTLADNLDSRGLKNVEYNMSIVRGIDYYTGIVFEAADAKNQRLGSLFGGGRYDALPKIFGRPELSATGAAGGIERIAMSLGDAKGAPAPVAYVAVAGESASSYALKVQKALRDVGVPCEASLGPKALSKQMEDASRLGAAWAVITGEKEASSESVTLRDMRTGGEELLPLSEALSRLRS